MRLYDFGVVLAPLPDGVEAALDALYDAGCDDATIVEYGQTPVLYFERQGKSLNDVLARVFSELALADMGARVTRVVPDDIVTAAEIARRTSLSREMVRRYSAGDRVRGGFPPPIAMVDTQRLWSWLDVLDWLLEDDRQGKLSEDDRVIAREIRDVNQWLATSRDAEGSLTLSVFEKRLRPFEIAYRS